MALSLPPPPQVAKDALRAAYGADPRPHKAWLCGGACLGPGGVFTPCPGFDVPVPPQQGDPSNQPTAGEPTFNEAIRRNLGPTLATQVLQTVGGTGALRLALQTWRALRPHARLWLTDPTWSNHAHIARLTGITIHRLPWRRHGAQLDLDAAMSALKRARAGDIVLLHGVGHHPTGLDPTPAQWLAFGQRASLDGWVPLIDVAFTGLIGPPFTDLRPVSALADQCGLGMLALSLAKSTGLHNERPAALAVFGSADSTLHAHLVHQARGMWAAPPREVALKIARQLRRPELRASWLGWLAGRRAWLADRRGHLLAAYSAEGLPTELIEGGVGLFVPLGVSVTQAAALRDQSGLYIGAGYANLSALADDLPARVAREVARLQRAHHAQD